MFIFLSAVVPVSGISKYRFGDPGILHSDDQKSRVSPAVSVRSFFFFFFSYPPADGEK